MADLDGPGIQGHEFVLNRVVTSSGDGIGNIYRILHDSDGRYFPFMKTGESPGALQDRPDIVAVTFGLGEEKADSHACLSPGVFNPQTGKLIPTKAAPKPYQHQGDVAPATDQLFAVTLDWASTAFFPSHSTTCSK